LHFALPSALPCLVLPFALDFFVLPIALLFVSLWLAYFSCLALPFCLAILCIFCLAFP
jgi:hypothetical protein